MVSTVSPQQLGQLQSQAGCIRNICVLAHVDHGKTTLSDNLIGSNGLIHPKLVGKLRYLDFREDEQLRAITMKSSSISLLFRPKKPLSCPEQFPEYLVNLIDSPGHVDFCSEVSTAARLSDGALVLVDVCEGVHIQTHAVLRQAWEEHVRPCLVLNKIDRLIAELKLSPVEAYERIKSIIQEVNGIISAFRSEKYMSDVDAVLAGPANVGGGEEEERPEEDELDEEDAFSPERGNVAFASAMDGWAFRVDQLAELYATKLGASVKALRRALWGDHFYSPKAKKIVGKKAAAGKLKPMFAQFVLEPLWQVYSAILDQPSEAGGGASEALLKIIKAMNIAVPPRDLQHKDAKVVLQSVMSRWLPLSDAVLSMVVECLPDPRTAQPERLHRLLPARPFPPNTPPEVQAEVESVTASIERCDASDSAPCVVFVSKMFAVPVELLPRESFGATIGPPSAEEERDCFLAFARVFSGVMHAGQRVQVLTGGYDPAAPESSAKWRQEATVEGLYMMMGQGLEPLASVPAGNVVGIRGLGQQILKAATLSSTPLCRPFASMMFQAAPIVRVAVEPADPADMAALARGLRLLNRADPFVEVTVSPSGEHVIAAAGEVHLERCITDLHDRFARVRLEVSPPLVAFRETVQDPPEEREGPATITWSTPVEATTPNTRCTVRVRVARMPAPMTSTLDEASDVLRSLLVEGSPPLSATSSTTRPRVGWGAPATSANPGPPSGGADHHHPHPDIGHDPVAHLRSRLLSAVGSKDAERPSSSAGAGTEAATTAGRTKARELATWHEALRKIWALGPRRVGPNLLLVPDLIEGGDGNAGHLVRGGPEVSQKLGLFEGHGSSGSGGEEDVGEAEQEERRRGLSSEEAESLGSSVVAGFQLATSAGPLCEEPMWGLAFCVEAVVRGGREGAGEEGGEGGAAVGLEVERYGPFTGQVMTAVREACRAAVLGAGPRIAEALYLCEVSTTAEALGPVYAVLGRRRAHILKEELREGSALFTVHAHLPVTESFGFADELRRKSSGAASPQLVLSHWDALSEDPFFVPRTEEELEEFGDGAHLLHNVARRLIDAVRRRKGLPVEEKVVEHATKQRTLARKV